MRNLFICAFLALLLFACQFRLEPSEPLYYGDEIIVDYSYCLYDPLPLDASDMIYCESYEDAECCTWVYHRRIDTVCQYDWCFRWDICEWEYIYSECW